MKRGTDRAVSEIQYRMLRILEPPGCQMTHCPDYAGAFGFCNCRKGLVPGRCGKHRAFLKRQQSRAPKRAAKEQAEWEHDCVLRQAETSKRWAHGGVAEAALAVPTPDDLPAELAAAIREYRNAADALSNARKPKEGTA